MLVRGSIMPTCMECAHVHGRVVFWCQRDCILLLQLPLKKVKILTQFGVNKVAKTKTESCLFQGCNISIIQFSSTPIFGFSSVSCSCMWWSLFVISVFYKHSFLQLNKSKCSRDSHGRITVLFWMQKCPKCSQKNTILLEKKKNVPRNHANANVRSRDYNYPSYSIFSPYFTIIWMDWATDIHLNKCHSVQNERKFSFNAKNTVFSTFS